MIKNKLAVLVICFSLYALVTTAQAPSSASQQPSTSAPATEFKASLKLGPGDLVHVTVYDMPELEQRFRVSDQGMATLALIGELKVAGLTASELGHEIAAKLQEGDFAKRPNVTVMVEEYTTQGVAVIGEVNKPGIVPVYSGRSVLDILSAAGGLKDTASTELLIRRQGQTGDPERVQLGRDRQSLSGPMVEVNPGDQLVVPLAGIVYMLGDLNRPGGYTMSENGKISLLQAVAMAGGTTQTSSENHTRLLRPGANGYEEKSIPLKDIMAGKQKDIELQPRDVVYIPFSGLKHALLGTQAILGSATSAAVFHF
jgi:polysaccharide export outer membrane protein